MHYKYEKILHDPNRSFTTFDEIGPVIKCSFHVHPEYELTYIMSSNGTRFIGDHVSIFSEGDLALIGPMVPHHYYNLPQDSLSEKWGHARLVQFREDFAGSQFFQMSEMKPLRQMLDAAKYGIEFPAATAQEVLPLLNRLFESDGPERVIVLLQILSLLASSSYNSLSRISGDSIAVSDARINEVLRYIHTCLEKGHELSLVKVAKKASMTPEAFSRYFKKTTFQCFIDYVNKVKIGKACHLLINTNKTVAEVCFSSGFANLSNFNRTFLKFKKMSPREFRNRFMPSFQRG